MVVMVLVLVGLRYDRLGPVLGAIRDRVTLQCAASTHSGAHVVLRSVIILAVVMLPQGFTSYVRDAVRRARVSVLDKVRMVNGCVSAGTRWYAMLGAGSLSAASVGDEWSWVAGVDT